MSCSLARNRVQRTSLNVYDPDIFNCSRQSAEIACTCLDRRRRARNQLAHLADSLAIVGLAEYSRSRHEHIGARRLHVRDVIELHAAIDLDVDTESAPRQLAPDVAQLVQRGRDKPLAAESRMHAHHEDHVEMLARKSTR